MSDEQLEFPEEEQENLPVQANGNQVGAIERVTPDNLERLVAEAEAWVDFYNRIRKIALRATDPQDWILHDNKPYLQDDGVAKVMKVIGASTRNFTPIRSEPRKDENGRVDIYYEVSGEIVDFNGKTFTNKGASSTRDKFFAERWREKTDKDGNRILDESKKPVMEKYLKNIDEINLSDVKKKAVTNLKHRLLQDAFRLNPTKEDLQEHFGEDGFRKIKGFSFGKGTQGGSPDSADAKELRTKLRNLILEIAGDNKAEARKILQDETSFKGKDGKEFKGYTEVDKVSAKMLKQTYDKIKKNHADGKYN